MSRFSGPQGAGARRRVREQKRREAIARNALTQPNRRAASRRPCPTHKVRYRDEHEARVELVGRIVSRNLGSNRRHERRVYECPKCFGWHHTSRPEKPKSVPWMTFLARFGRRKAAAA